MTMPSRLGGCFFLGGGGKGLNRSCSWHPPTDQGGLCPVEPSAGCSWLLLISGCGRERAFLSGLGCSGARLAVHYFTEGGPSSWCEFGEGCVENRLKVRDSGRIFQFLWGSYDWHMHPYCSTDLAASSWIRHFTGGFEVGTSTTVLLISHYVIAICCARHNSQPICL